MYEPKKELGQNFLLNDEVADTIVNALNLSTDEKNEEVVEIGAGLGALTQKLAAKLLNENSTIYAVEIDDRFIPKLENMFLENLNLKIVKADILDWLPHFTPKENFKVVGSLPYYITSPIIHTLLEMQKQPDIIVILIQKEVAERIANKEPDGTYLSVVVQTFFDVEYITSVDKSQFDPIPQVDGGILKLTKKPEQVITFEEIKRYEKFLHRGFSNPRKMLNKVFNTEELQKINVDGNLRAQNLSVEKWVSAYNLLK